MRTSDTEGGETNKPPQKGRVQIVIFLTQYLKVMIEFGHCQTVKMCAFDCFYAVVVQLDPIEAKANI